MTSDVIERRVRVVFYQSGALESSLLTILDRTLTGRTRSEYLRRLASQANRHFEGLAQVACFFKFPAKLRRKLITLMKSVPGAYYIDDKYSGHLLYRRKVFWKLII